MAKSVIIGGMIHHRLGSQLVFTSDDGMFACGLATAISRCLVVTKMASGVGTGCADHPAGASWASSRF